MNPIKQNSTSLRLPVVSVFVSSTWEDLQPERQAVEKALGKLRETKFLGMEYFGSRPETTREVSLKEVDRADVYLGIFAGRYGSGITEAEYRRARERDIPCLIYLKDDVAITGEGRETDPDKAGKLAALKKELLQNHTITFFKYTDDLTVRVTTDIQRWLFDEYNVLNYLVQGISGLPTDYSTRIQNFLTEYLVD